MNHDRSCDQTLKEINERLSISEARYKTAEQQLAEHRAMLARASRLSATSEMAAELIHELNQPLVAIHNYAQAIQHAASKGADANLDFIVQCSKSIDEVAADARSVIGRLRSYVTPRELNLAPVQINDLIVKSLKLMNFDLPSQHAQLDLQLSPDLPTVDADAVQIEQVFVNLIRNALEAIASQDQGNRLITIRTQQQKDGLQVSVEDSGAGVADEFIRHVFRPFQTTKEGGLGFGLAISESIVAGHHGRMWHEAALPHGARFHFTLPRCTESPGPKR